MIRSLAVAAAAAALAAPPSAPPPAKDPIHAPPTAPLDPRIKPEKITESDLPPLPQRIFQPLPADFRLADRREQVPIDEAHWQRAHDVLERGLDWLIAHQGQAGGWSPRVEATPTDRPEEPSPVSVAITAMAVKAIVQARPDTAEDPAIHRALAYIRTLRRPDGSFEGGALTNYVTSTVVTALASLDGHDVRDDLQDAVAWLQNNQWDQTEGIAPRQDWYGGAGYGNSGRPDLSNTQLMLDALHDAGVSPDEPSVQRALAFISRAQNLKATNPSAWAGDDGGFVYTPANGGESFASEAAGEGRFGEKVPAGQPRSLRSYGSMTYAGFKSMLYAGLSPDDVRVRAAFDWIRRHWTFDENPGLGALGLDYYYHTMSRALRAAQQDTITDLEGRAHNWRQELIDAIASRQREDGRWQNTAERWLEAEPVMATIDAILALEEALKPAAGAAQP